ncbi:MAG: hypothetical protein J5I93_05085 [Pirellulaceae bacterium]|nr:hypothetical protein [Pirellulaceae bacterium]
MGASRGIKRRRAWNDARLVLEDRLVLQDKRFLPAPIGPRPAAERVGMESPGQTPGGTSLTTDN